MTGARLRLALILAAAALLALAGLAVVTAAPSAQARHAGHGVVLGSKKFAPNGNGFGTVKPSHFYNGGDASGSVSHIQWHHWGHASARGRGLNPIFKPQGGYYRKPAPIHLKAFDIGHCGHSHHRAYRKLTFRVAKTPNGAIHGHWRSWSGSRTICKFAFG